MAHRTQITLDDRQYDRLRREAARTGASLSELIRRAVDEKYAGSELTLEEKLRVLDETAGIWSDEQAEEVLAWKRSSEAARLERLDQ